MPEQWGLTAEERTAVILAVQPDDPYGAVLERIAQAQCRKIVEWGEDPCPHRHSKTGRFVAGDWKKHQCSQCWVELRKEALERVLDSSRRKEKGCSTSS